MPELELLRVSEAAELLGVDPTTLRDWALKGRIAFVLTPGKHRRFRRSDLEAFLAANTQPVRDVAS